MIEKPIRQSEISKVIRDIHIGDTIIINRGGNKTENLIISGVYPSFLMAVNSFGYKECLRWSEVVIKYRQGRILQSRKNILDTDS